MKDEHDFSNAVRNLYAKHLKKPSPASINDNNIVHFQALAEEMGISYQTLINSFLHECAVQHKKPALKW
ncbi:antitoxin [Neisseria chenwenguii]|uniref:Antitoxin n=1 Tax=Neisseria chenwenguii TaxID=1853278 RepID=A0A220RZR1_9NEIS|nr:antitoxin [Neisseria chenwenguii]ASK26694.1 antitoxin [Neisseria chenwenguii]ROV56356.1 antitoxin [Neisseria chenwenguii]